MFRYKLVQFADGTYGVRRRTLLGYKFIDLSFVSLDCDLLPYSFAFKNSCTGTREAAEEALQQLYHKAVIDYGTVVK